MLRHRNEFPVEGELPGVRRGDRLAEHCAADGGGAAGPRGARQLRYLHLHQLDPLASLRAGVGGQVRRAGAGGRRCADSRVRVRGRPRQRRPRHQGNGRPLSRWWWTTTTPSGGRSTTTTGPLCTSSTPRVGSGTTTSARASTRNPRWSSRCSCGRPVLDVDPGLVRLEPDGVEAAADWASLGLTGDLPRLRTRRGLRLARRRRAGRASRLLGAGRAAAATSGRCQATGESAPVPALLNEPGGSISYQFHARDLHLVMGPPAGQSAGALQGAPRRRAPGTRPRRRRRRERQRHR